VNVGVIVTDQPSSGAVTDPVTVTIPDPPGMTPGTAGGDGWNCGNMDAQNGFICVTVGDVGPGQSYPEINTNWHVNGDVTGTAQVTADAYTADQASTSGAQGSEPVKETPAAPDVTAQVVTSGPVAAGGKEDLSVNVADATTAGPSTSDVNVTVRLPDQIQPDSVYGYGWDCTEYTHDVTCHRAPGGDGLQPGSMYPPITVSGTARSRWDGGQIWATVG
jgi:hypothetical protein